MENFDEDSIVEWLKSFDFIEDGEIPDFVSLRTGHVIAKFFNYIVDQKFDVTSLLPIPTGTSWINFMKNMKALEPVISPVLENAGYPCKIEATQIARGQNHEPLINLIVSLVCLAFTGPHKSEIASKTKKLPEHAQRQVKQILKEHLKKPGTPAKMPAQAQKNEEKKPDQAPATPVKEPPSTPTRTMISEAKLTEIRSKQRQIEEENNSLRRKREELMEELKSLNNVTTMSSDDQQYDNLLKQIDEKKRISAELDAEIASYKEVNEQVKGNLIREVDGLNAKLRSLEEERDRPFDPSQYANSPDADIRKLHSEIVAAEERIQPAYIKQLQGDLEKLKKTYKKLKEGVDTKKEKIGDSPDKDSEEKDEESASLQIEEEIEKIAKSNNAMNAEILVILARTEAIQRLSKPVSYLEHIRTSDEFLSHH